MTHISIIPARGGSKRLPGKNKAILNGRPLVCWTIEEAIESGIYSRVIVSTDDKEIAEIALASGAEVPFIRPSQLSGDLVPTLDVLRHAMAEVFPDYDFLPDFVHTLQPTSPLRTREHIRRATQLIEADTGADSLVSCVRVPSSFLPDQLMKRFETGRMKICESPVNSTEQDFTELFARNGAAIYISALKNLSENRILGDNLVGFEMSPWDSIDIDTLEDFRVAEALLKARNGW